MDIGQEEVNAHDALIAAGAAIVKAHAFVADRPASSALGFWARREVKKGIHLYKQALKINPRGWSSMWALGKLHQRLGAHMDALEWFTKAHQIKPDQVDVLREAGLAALSVGAKDEAQKLCFAAVRLAPDDLGLQSNLALAYLIGGDDEHAEECARVAVSRAPRDVSSQAVLLLVQEVRHGKKKRPERFG